ncbi:MAG: STAS domain-containing protein [Oscillospiraceae bacterium]|jgi:stage II sporulation protein AA (anti-sigma F factor antagonist)|nr:STAS domain-containing protein [Oscillospiraceae bacterium]
MSVQTNFENGELRFSLGGELDHHSARDVMRKIADEIDRRLPGKCVLDLAGVGFTDSSGIAVLLRTHKHMRELGGSLSVENVHAQPAKVFRAANVGKMVAFQEVR